MMIASDCVIRFIEQSGGHGRGVLNVKRQGVIKMRDPVIVYLGFILLCYFQQGMFV